MLRAPAPVNFGLIPGIGLGVALVLVPWLGPLVLAASVPVQQFGAVSLGGTALTATKVAIVAALAAFAIQILSRRDDIRFSILFVPYIAWFGAMFISLLGATDVRAGISEMYRWSVTIFALVIALYGIRNQRAIIATALAMGFGVVFEGLLGVVQSIARHRPVELRHH